MILTDSQIVELQKWWLGELKKITANEIRTEEIRQDRAMRKTFKDLDGYRGVGDILDAYGMGCISSRKKDRLMDLMEKRDMMQFEDPMHQAKMNLLQELGDTARQIIAEKSAE